MLLQIVWNLFAFEIKKKKKNQIKCARHNPKAVESRYLTVTQILMKRFLLTYMHFFHVLVANLLNQLKMWQMHNKAG